MNVRFPKMCHVVLLCLFQVFSLSTMASESASRRKNKSFSEREHPSIPNEEILLIWEHSCIRHIEQKEIVRARQVLNVMNWQCDKKKRIGVTQAEYDTSRIKLQEAINARKEAEEAGRNWMCNPPNLVLNSTKQHFYERIGAEIINILEKMGAPNHMVNLVLAQAALETSWGTRVIDSNIFNIKGSYNGQSVRVTTHEELADGTRIEVVDSFRLYPNFESSIMDYLNVLEKRWPRAYRALFSDNSVGGNFLDGLRAGEPGGYATDLLYAEKLKRLASRIAQERSGPVSPTYLKCLDRARELNGAKEDNT